MIGFVNVISVFTLKLTGEAAWPLHKRPENEMNKRTQKHAELNFTSLFDFSSRNS